MKWRHRLIVGGGFNRTGPCGQERLKKESASCIGCWNARRQSFHQPRLYLAFRKSAEKFFPDKRSFDDFENDLLSWSSVWLKRGRVIQTHSSPDESAVSKIGEPIQMTYRYMGRYLGNKPANPAPDKDKATNFPELREFLKLCPILSGNAMLSLERPAGFVIPVLKHGQLFRIFDEINGSPQQEKIQINTNTKIVPLKEVSPEKAFLPKYSDHTRSAIDEAGYRLFGFEAMYPFQHKILARVLTGKSIFGISSTGSGKSECFILPSMILPGVTVVVSPLVSLMMDQYDQRITERYGLDHLVTYINGEVNFKERQARLQRLEMGYYKLVYFTPEQLERSYILDVLRRTNERVGIRYLAMDEAHCISQWGHDFRPSYLNIVRRMKDYGLNPIRIALTATASPYVRKDVCEELGLDNRLLDDGGDVFVESSNRPELNLIVRVYQNTDLKVYGILSDLRCLLEENRNNQSPGAAIVFMPKTGGDPDSVSPTEDRKEERGKRSANVTHFAAFLERRLNQRVAIYHSKMELDVDDRFADQTARELGDLRGRNRRSEQQNFIKDEVPIMVATKGFGMGIDKDNVRLVIHRTPPSNLEAYAQEAGRAGRDGNLADVILYYSPDSPEKDSFGNTHREQSDYEIQSYFLNEKYIRRQDVLVMWAFLRRVARRVGKTLYFTNDEAIDFFNRCTYEPFLAGLDEPFSWPDFPSRRTFGYESVEHKRILDIGHLYKNQTDYLDRILQALYCFRPNIPDIGTRVAFLEQVQETGAELKDPEVLNPEAILQSNAYFGKILRQAGISVNELTELITNRSLFPIATRLGLSLRETASLLYDIRSSDGFMINGCWRPALLNFLGIFPPRSGPAANKRTLDDWLTYAGAFNRATKAQAYDRAKRAKRKYPQLCDWFSWEEVNRPRGWEVLPGTIFEIDDQFNHFLQAFIQLHDQRQENDWAAYRRLLRDYIGVMENGELPARKESGNCLRSVLLGYLETYELVSGDNCFSCSRCVKDGNFRQYTLEQRRSAVVRMLPPISALFDRLKEQPQTIPSREDVQLLFHYIRQEEQEGHSLLGYFSGWSARLLDQMPDHLTILWLRLEGMAEELLPFQHQEFVKNARTLNGRLGEADLKRLDQLVHKVSRQYQNDAAYIELLADIAHKLGDFRKEADLLQKQIERLQSQPSDHRDWLYSVTVRLLELDEKNGPFCRSEIAVSLRLIAGRTAKNEELSKKWYESTVQDWDWEKVSEELHEQSRYESLPHSQAALCISWANDSIMRWSILGQWINKHPDIIAQWPDTCRLSALNMIPIDVLSITPELAQQAITKCKDPERSIRLGIKLWTAHNELSSQSIHRIAEEMTNFPQFARSAINDFSRDSILSFLEMLNSEAEFSEWNKFEIWLDLQPDDTPSCEYALRLLEIGVRLLPSSLKRSSCIRRLEKLFNKAIHQNNLINSALSIWVPIACEDENTLANLLRIPNIPDRGHLIREIIHRIAEQKCIERLANLPSDIQDRIIVRARIFSRVVLKHKDTIRNAKLGYTLKAKDLQMIRDDLRWKDNQEHADMLAFIFSNLVKWLNPNWETPLSYFVESLIFAGRLDKARKICLQMPNLYFYMNGERMDAEELIERVNPIKRGGPIPEEYMLILRSVL